MEEPREFDTNYTSEVTCPYCGYEHSDSWEFGDSDDNHECGNCEEEFSYYRDVEVTYSSYKKKIDNEH